MEAMASYMRADTAIDASGSITTDFSNLPRAVSNQRVTRKLSLVSLISYKINTWQIVKDYCDILEYKGGGVRPSIVCKGMQTSTKNLVAYPESSRCTDRQGFFDVPIASNDQHGFMNLIDLHCGKPVIFQIPNSQWLVDNGWIAEGDKDSAIFVKKFEVFMPTVSTFKGRKQVKVEVVGENKLPPTDAKHTSYVIVPNEPFEADYQEGKGRPPCGNPEISNPYGQTLPKICPFTSENQNNGLGSKTKLFTSIYSQWQVTVSGYKSAAYIPNPANTDFRLKVRVKFCILNKNRKDEEMNFKDRGNKGRKGKRRKRAVGAVLKANTIKRQK